jgi:hypothetical protein
MVSGAAMEGNQGIYHGMKFLAIDGFMKTTNSKV